MPLRPLACLIAALGATSALAQDGFLTGSPLECAAIEAPVVYGLIDGGEGADTSAISGTVADSDGRACLFEVEARGYASGLMDETCEAAMEIVAAYGAPEDWEVSATEIASGVLLDDTQFCEELLAESGS